VLHRLSLLKNGDTSLLISPMDLLSSVIGVLCQQNYLQPKDHLLPLQQTSALLNQITWENIFAIRFSGTDVPEDSIIRCLAKTPSLKSATFSFCNSLSYEALSYLKVRAAGLMELDLYGCEQLTDDWMKVLKGLTNIRKLKLGGCSQLTANGISCIESFLSLEELNLDGCNIQDGWLLSFAHITTLRQLLLFGNRLTGEGFQHLSYLTNLRTLYLDGSYNLTDPDFDCLAALTNLMELNLDSCKVSNASLKSLEYLEKLNLLSLNACELSDTGMVSVRNLTNLQFLDLGGVQRITDATIESIHKLNRLEYLVLDGCHQLTDKALNYLSQHPKLQYLSIEDCALVTDDGVVSLSSLADLTLLSTWGCPLLTHKSFLTNLKNNEIPSFFSWTNEPPSQEQVAQTTWEGEPLEADTEMPPLVDDDELPPLVGGDETENWNDPQTRVRQPGFEDEQGGWTGRGAGWDKQEYGQWDHPNDNRPALSGSGSTWEKDGDGWEQTSYQGQYDADDAQSYSYRVVPSDVKSPQRNHDNDGWTGNSWDRDKQFDDDMELAMQLSLMDQEPPSSGLASSSASSGGWEPDDGGTDLTQAVPIEPQQPLLTTTNSPWQVEEPEDDDLAAALALSVSAEYAPQTDHSQIVDDWNTPKPTESNQPSPSTTSLPVAENWTTTKPKIEEWTVGGSEDQQENDWNQPTTTNSSRTDLEYWNEKQKQQDELDEWNKPRTADWEKLQKQTYGEGWTNTVKNVDDDEDEDFKRAMALSVGEDPDNASHVISPGIDVGMGFDAITTSNNNTPNETKIENKMNTTESVYQQQIETQTKLTYCVQDNALKGWRKLGAWLEKKRAWEEWKKNNTIPPPTSTTTNNNNIN